MASQRTDFILLRHGETDANRERRFQGHVDVPLNAAGQAQAQRVAARLADEPRIDGFFTSDLRRARETAAFLSAVPPPGLAGVTPEPMAQLREQSFGIFDGMRVPDIQQQHPGEWQSWLRFEADAAPPGGETARAFRARVLEALRAIAARQTPGATVLVVTHGGVLDMVYRAAVGQSLAGPRVAAIPNAGINRVRLLVDPDGASPERLQIQAWADVEHLAGLPPQAVYDQQRLAQEALRPAQVAAAESAETVRAPGR